MAIRILLADDYEPFRREIRQLLESHADIEVVAEAESGLQAISLARKLHPDVAVLDIRMPPVSGIAAIPEVLLGSPRTAVLILSIHNDKRYLIQAVKNGARGYLLKDSAENILVDAIHSLHQGRTFFDPGVLGYAAEA